MSDPLWAAPDGGKWYTSQTSTEPLKCAICGTTDLSSGFSFDGVFVLCAKDDDEWSEKVDESRSRLDRILGWLRGERSARRRHRP